MPKKKRKKTRDAASYRAASLKGARAKRRMMEARQLDPDWDQFRNRVDELIMTLPTQPRRTIDLIPKVKWP